MDLLERFDVSYYPSGKEEVALVLCVDRGSPSEHSPQRFNGGPMNLEVGLPCEPC